MIKSWSWIGSNVTRRRMRIRLIKRQIEALRLHCSGHAQDSPLMQSPANRLAIFGPEVAVASSAQESCHRGSTEPCAECWPVLVTLHAESRRVERDTQKDVIWMWLDRESATIRLLVFSQRLLPNLAEPGGSVRGERANLTGLVLSCIEAKFCKKICVGKLSPRSTQCTPLHRSRSSFFSKKKKN